MQLLLPSPAVKACTGRLHWRWWSSLAPRACPCPVLHARQRAAGITACGRRRATGDRPAGRPASQPSTSTATNCSTVGSQHYIHVRTATARQGREGRTSAAPCERVPRADPSTTVVEKRKPAKSSRDRDRDDTTAGQGTTCIIICMHLQAVAPCRAVPA
jgi:hypothetical protein